MQDEVQAKVKNIRISAQKTRLVANQIRGLKVEKALNILDFSKKKASLFIKNVLISAIANAEHNNSLDVDKLYISSIYIDEGKTNKSFRARAKGRGNRILKRSSHITLKVSEQQLKSSSEDR